MWWIRIALVIAAAALVVGPLPAIQAQPAPAMSRLNRPNGIAVDGSGRIYIADTANDRIVRISDMRGTGWVTLGGPWRRDQGVQGTDQCRRR